MNALYMQIKKFFTPTNVDPQLKDEIQERLSKDIYRTERIMFTVIILLEATMIILFLLKPGGPFLKPRRTGYFMLYLFALVSAMIFMRLIKVKHLKSSLFPLKCNVYYVSVACIWACGVTALDQFGGNGLVVFSYMLPAMAALSVLTTIQSIVIFGCSFAVLNVMLLFTPEGFHNMFSNIVNSAFIVILSIVISNRLYNAKISIHLNNIIIQQQYKEIQEVNEQLNQLAVTDQLTEMNNRRYLTDTVQVILNNLTPQEISVAGLLLDIDHFKEFNDRYGHAAGDVCLKAIADEIKSFTNHEHAYAVRYGGEEFFICLINCDTQAAKAAAERLRTRIVDKKIERDDTETGCVTVSIGICVQSAVENINLDKFIEKADIALYEAKRSGRNKTALKL